MPGRGAERICRLCGVVTICSVIDACAERRLRRRVKLSNELQKYTGRLALLGLGRRSCVHVGSWSTR